MTNTPHFLILLCNIFCVNFTQISVQTLSMMSAKRYETFCTEENVVAFRKDAIPNNQNIPEGTHLGSINVYISK